MDSTDTVDNQLMAADLMSTDNFVPRSGGTKWHFKAPDGVPDDTQPTVPTDAQAQSLRSLNALQTQLNSLNREQIRLKTALFQTWWTYITDKQKPGVDSGTLILNALNTVNGLISKIRANYDDTNNGVGLISTLQSQIATQSAALGQIQAGTDTNFYTQRDPTIFIAGLSSKWPTDSDQPLPVRLEPGNAISQPEDAPIWPPFSSSLFQEKAPDSLAEPLATAFGEALGDQKGFMYFEPPSPYRGNGDSLLNSTTSNYENGWFPLFIEWEIEYYHIPFEQWEFGPQGVEARVGYGLMVCRPILHRNLHVPGALALVAYWSGPTNIPVRI